MKVYTFETGKKVFEFYNIKAAKNKALEIAKETKKEVLLTCTNKPSYKQDWYTVCPDGTITTDALNFRGDN